MSEENDYFPVYDEDDKPDQEICDITGEECIGDPMFCEECPISLPEKDDTTSYTETE